MKKLKVTGKRIWRYLRQHKLMFFSALFFTVVATVCNALIPLVTGLPITEVTKNIKMHQPVNFDYILKILVLILLIGFGYCVAQFLANYLMTNVVQTSMRNLRRDIEEKINRLPVAYFDRHQQGDVLSRVTNDVDAISNALQQSFIAILNSLLGIGLAVGMMFYINVKMAVISLIMIPLSFYISRTIVKISQKYFKEQQNSLGELNSYVQENMTGFSVLKAFGQEKESMEDFKKISHRLSNFGFKSAVISGLMMPLVQLTAYATYIGMSVLGSFFILQGVLSVGNLQAFIQYIWQISQPMGQITQLSAVLQSAFAATSRVFEFLDEPEETEMKTLVQLPDKIEGKVSFENVSFAYSQDKPLIQNLNFEVQPGQTVAIVGPTGAGKTTLINLLMRFYDVSQGAIKVDNIATTSISKADVRSLFGMVLQDAWVYNDTITENIRFGRLDATTQEVMAVARHASLDHFIRHLPGGYEMVINEEASNLSLGQKQLLTIARAMIADPKILILDEATSSVDTRLEALIQEAMNKMMQGRTSFVIAHRLSTIREADLILVMENGKIIEQGTHESLLEQKGFYETLYKSQFQEE